MTMPLYRDSSHIKDTPRDVAICQGLLVDTLSACRQDKEAGRIKREGGGGQLLNCPSVLFAVVTQPQRLKQK